MWNKSKAILASVVFIVACVAMCLPACAQGAAAVTPAKTRLDDARKVAEEAKARAQTAQRELERAEELVAIAERSVVQETCDRIRAGEEAAFAEMYDRLLDRQNFIEYGWGQAVKGGVSPEILAKLMREKWPTAGPNNKHKLCWLLGENASKEAAAELRAILGAEEDEHIIANAIAALRRFSHSPEDANAVRKFVNDARELDPKLTKSIGFHPYSTLGEYASSYLTEIEPKDMATVPGDVVVEQPTLICLGFEWLIQGDSNKNCTVQVAYRKTGQAGWKQGYPFLRCDNRTHYQYKVPFLNMLSGSIFDLDPDTDYEVKLTLHDPDGGDAERIVTARTKAVPEVFAGLRTLHVVPGEATTPAKGQGTKDDPFVGLAAAVGAAQPGDVLLFHEGNYLTAGLDIAKSGEEGKPIVFRGVDVEKVIFEGAQKWNLRFHGRAYLHFENISFVNAQEVLSGRGASFIVVRGCKISGKFTVGIEGRTLKNSKTNQILIGREWYVADNIIRGNTDWVSRKGRNWGIILNGTGHVICHNRITNNWDCISLAVDSFVPLGTTEPVTLSMDIYNNDLQEAMDDGVEADYTWHNVRIFRNRLVNTFSSLSFQPMFGGPGYMLYNAMYNTTNKPFKLHVKPSGMIIAHNTCASAVVALDGGDPFNALFRNNLMLGTGGTKGYWMSLWAGDGFDMDYTGYNQADPTMFIKLNNVRYNDMASFVQDVGIMKHAVLLDWDVFAKPQVPPGAKVVATYSNDYLGLRQDSKAIDAGVVMPGINDGYAGKAPDLGCYEFGKPVPHYGPR